MKCFLYSRVVAGAVALLGVAACLVVLEGAPAAQKIETVAAPDLEVVQLRSNFFMIAGAGGNIAVQVGEDGLLVTDSGVAARADAVLAAIKTGVSAW